MWPRLPGPVYRRQLGETNRESFRALLRAGQIHAVLAFEGCEPVGWCSFGPRGSFPRINARRELASDYDAGTWAIVCFFIPSRFRGKGIATALADAAAKRCFALGAQEVEGYPVEPSRPGATVPNPSAWTGVPAVFAANGFRRLKRGAGLRPNYLRSRRRG
jgi:GNAT superfamily N-acetyltransferase